MKKINKYILTSFLIAISFVSCEDALTEKPYSVLVDSNAYESIEDAENLVTAVYTRLKGSAGNEWAPYYTYNYLMMGEAPTDTYGVDNWEIGTFAYELGTLPSTDAQLYSLWSAAYGVIVEANFALKVLEDMDIDEDRKSVMIGEVKFLRALAYYDLTFNFGDVVLNLDASNPNKPIVPQSAIIEQIIADLTDAIGRLRNNTEPARASKGAALALRSKTHLNNHNWAAAASDAKSVMELGVFDLHNSVKELTYASNNMDNEWVFITMSSSVQGGAALEVLAHHTVTNKYANRSWGRLRLNGELLYNKFELQDERRALIGNGYLNGELLTKDVNYDDGSSATLPIWWAMPGTPEFEAIKDRDSVDLWIDRNLSLASIKDMGDQNRFENMENGAANWGTNFPIIRYAEVILNRAEALNELGDVGGALSLLNQVRSRAKASQLTIGDQTALREAILQERAFEFFMEGKRRIDLIRSGKQNYIDAWNANLINKYGSSVGRVDLNDVYFPIPQKEIDANPSIN